MSLSPAYLQKIAKEVKLSGLPANSKTVIVAALEGHIPDLMIRPKDIPAVTGLSLSTIERREKDGSFPRRRKISKYAVGWSWRADIQPWLDSCRDDG